MGGGRAAARGVGAEEAAAATRVGFFCAAETCDFGQSCGWREFQKMQVEKTKGTHGILARELLLARLTREDESALLGRNGGRVGVGAGGLGAVDAVLADILLDRLGRQSDGRSDLGLVRRALLPRRRGRKPFSSCPEAARERRVEGWCVCVEGSSSAGAVPRDLLALHRCEGLGLRHRVGLSLCEDLRVQEGGLRVLGESGKGDGGKCGRVCAALDSLDNARDLNERTSQLEDQAR